MTKVNSITLYANNRYLAKLTAENNPNLNDNLEFTIEKIDSFGNFDLYEECPNNQYRIDLLQANVKLKIEIEIDAENREFSIKGHAISLEFLGDIADYNDPTNMHHLNRAIIRSINDPNSSFHYDIKAEVEFVDDDWLKEGIKDEI